MRPVFALLAFASGLALALAGCSGSKPTAGTLSSSAPVPSSSASVSPSPTVTPVEAQVEAAVRTYYAELTKAAQTNDTSVLKTLTTQGCPCYRPVRVIQGNIRLGYTTRGAEFAVRSVRVHDVANNVGLAEVQTTEKAYDVIQGTKVIGHVAAREQLLDLSLVHQNTGAWVVTNQFNLQGKP